MLAAVVLLAVLAVLIPRSPLYLVNWINPRGQHLGRSTRSWMRDLRSPEPQTRREAISALGTIGDNAREAVPALAKILVEDPDPGARIEAGLALTKMDSATEAVPELAQALVEDEEPLVRMNAARALLRLGEEAKPAVPELIKALKDKANDTNANAFHATIQEVVAVALGKATAGTNEGVPALTEALKAARTIPGRKALARALGDVGPAAQAAVPPLQALLEDDNAYVREAARDALEKIKGSQ
jgi:HEAT repeat protein